MPVMKIDIDDIQEPTAYYGNIQWSKWKVHSNWVCRCIEQQPR